MKTRSGDVCFYFIYWIFSVIWGCSSNISWNSGRRVEFVNLRVTGNSGLILMKHFVFVCSSQWVSLPLVSWCSPMQTFSLLPYRQSKMTDDFWATSHGTGLPDCRLPLWCALALAFPTSFCFRNTGREKSMGGECHGLWEGINNYRTFKKKTQSKRVPTTGVLHLLASLEISYQSQWVNAGRPLTHKSWWWWWWGWFYEISLLTCIPEVMFQVSWFHSWQESSWAYKYCYLYSLSRAEAGAVA